MRILILFFCIVALTAILLWAAFRTSLGALMGSVFPDGFWVWLHAGAEDRGAESGYDLEWAVFAVVCAFVATIVVLLVDRWQRKSR
jgi:hypothetical protein